MSSDRDEMAERIRAGLDPAPVCPYVKVHGPNARCANCADWPRLDRAYAAEVNRMAAELDVPPAKVVSSVVDLERRGLITSGRKPIATGVLLDDEPASFYARLRRPRDWYGIRRLAARWAGALAMVVGAAAIMYAEGQRQPAPGVGFGIALGLLMGAALLLPLGRSNDG